MSISITLTLSFTLSLSFTAIFAIVCHRLLFISPFYIALVYGCLLLHIKNDTVLPEDSEILCHEGISAVCDQLHHSGGFAAAPRSGQKHTLAIFSHHAAVDENAVLLHQRQGEDIPETAVIGE